MPSFLIPPLEVTPKYNRDFRDKKKKSSECLCITDKFLHLISSFREPFVSHTGEAKPCSPLKALLFRPNNAVESPFC